MSSSLLPGEVERWCSVCCFRLWSCMSTSMRMLVVEEVDQCYVARVTEDCSLTAVERVRLLLLTGLLQNAVAPHRQHCT